jgi:hypothetical protein
MSQSLKDSAWLKRLCQALFSLFGITTGQPVAFDARGWLTNSTAAAGKKASYPKTTAGAQTLLAAANVDRQVLIVATVNETFAQTTGTKSAFDIGETGTTNKFKQTLNSGNAGAQTFYDGTLSAGKALLVTGTAATGDGAGGIDVSVVAAPLAS